MKTRTFNLVIRSNWSADTNHGWGVKKYILMQFDSEGLSVKYDIVYETDDRNMMKLVMDLNSCGKVVYVTPNRECCMGKTFLRSCSVWFDTVEI